MAEFPVYSQRDPRWSGQRLGTCNGTTIGSDGCYVTATAQVATHYDHIINPAQLDDIYTNRGYYASGCLMYDNNICKVYPDIKLAGVWNYPNSPADLSKLAMGPQDEIILCLDFDHNPGNGVQTHFVRVYWYDGVNITLDDPWYGTRENFKVHYGTNPAQTITKIIKYTNPTWKMPPQTTTTTPPPPPTTTTTTLPPTTTTTTTTTTSTSTSSTSSTTTTTLPPQKPEETPTIRQRVLMFIRKIISWVDALRGNRLP